MGKKRTLAIFGNILWFKLGIREVNFLPKRIVKEGEKLYLSVEIGRTKVLEKSQKHLERELLVEIDLETDRAVCYTIREIIGQESSDTGREMFIC